MSTTENGTERIITSEQWIAIESSKMLIASCAGIQNSYYWAIGDALQVTEHEIELLDAYVRNDMDLFTLVEQLGVKVGEHRTQEQEQGQEGGAGAIEGTDEAAADHSPQDESI